MEDLEKSKIRHRNEQLADEHLSLSIAKDIIVAHIKAGNIKDMPDDPLSDEAGEQILKYLFPLAKKIYLALEYRWISESAEPWE